MVRFLLLSLCILVCIQSTQVDCPANTMTYLSSFALGRQSDLNRTFTAIKNQIKVESITYSPRVGKTYTIQNLTLEFYIINSKETAKFISENHLRVQGSVLKLTYNFTWEKRQLGSSVHGTAEGAVLSDPIGFTKVIQLDQNNQPDQQLQEYQNITFTNNFPVSKVSPYSQNDSDILFEMMNSLKNHTTIKQSIVAAINSLYEVELNKTIESDSGEIKVNNTITYSYFDYRGEFKIVFDNPTRNLSISEKGIVFENSQVIKDDPNFDCGSGVPSQPKDVSIYGGVQSFYSNSLLKSTVRYLLSKKYFNIHLTQESWQSRAFQFFVGDLYKAIPVLKNVSAQTQVTGECDAHNDDSFNLSKKQKSYTQYQITLNYSCTLNLTDKRVAQFSILTKNTIDVSLKTKSLQFKINSIQGKAQFVEVPNYPIEDVNYANFLVSETLRVATGSFVFGTAYPTSSRVFPRLEISNDYLFLYDSSAIPHE